VAKFSRVDSRKLLFPRPRMIVLPLGFDYHAGAGLEPHLREHTGEFFSAGFKSAVLRILFGADSETMPRLKWFLK